MLSLPLLSGFCRRFGLPFLAVVFAVFLSACDDAAERALRHYDRGLSLVKNGAPEKAALEFRNALQMDENFVAARFELALLLERSGDLTGAVANLHAIVEIDPAHAKARVRLANAMLMANAPEQAMEHAQVATRTAPLLSEALIARSLAAYRLGDARLALSGAHQVLKTEPNNADAGLILAIERYDSGDLDKAHAILDAFIASNPESMPLHLTKLRYLTAEDDQTALGTHLTRMLERFPERADLRRTMVDWHLRNDNPVAAQRELKMLQKLLPDDPAPVLARVSLTARTRGNAAARELLNAEIELASDPDPLKLELAQFDAQLGDPAAAIKQFEEIVQETGSAEVRTEARLALARIQGSQQNFSAVDEVMSRLLEDDPGHAEAMALRAVAHLRRDAVEDALVDIKNALFEQPENPRYMTLAGEIYLRNGSPALAGESLASAVRDSSYAPEPVLAYARFLQSQGDDRAHQTLLETAWRKNPERLEVGVSLARLYVEQQNWEATDLMIPTLSALDPNVAKQIDAEISMGRREFVTATNLLDRVANANPNADGVLMAKVKARLRVGDRKAARKLIDAELRTSSQNIEALYLDAVLHELDANNAQAEQGYRKLVQSTPKAGFAYLMLAAFLDRTERVTEARKVLDLGLQSDPKNAMLRLHKASLALRSGDPQAAIAEFEEIYTIQPDSLLAANNLASALAEYASADQEQLARAEKIARRLAGSANPAFKDTYGWTRVLTGNATEAIADLQLAAESLPDNPWVRYHAGIAYLKAGKPAEARAHLGAALKLTENQPFLPRAKIKRAFADLED